MIKRRIELTLVGTRNHWGSCEIKISTKTKTGKGKVVASTSRTLSTHTKDKKTKLQTELEDFIALFNLMAKEKV